MVRGMVGVLNSAGSLSVYHWMETSQVDPVLPPRASLPAHIKGDSGASNYGERLCRSLICPQTEAEALRV